MLILTCLSYAGTIWSSLTLHRLPFNALLMSLGIVCLFECLANLAASVVYLIAQVGGPHHFTSPSPHSPLSLALVPLLHIVYILQVQ